MLKTRFGGVLFQAVAFVLAMSFVSLILVAVGASPLEAYKNMLTGSVGSMRKLAEVLVSFVPLLLVTAGLLLTFSAGLWNIGVEGQIVLGAIGTTWALRYFVDSTLPPALIIALSILAGMFAGALWAAFAGILKTFGGVNEIFGGLGLNFVSTALTLYLIFGPWKREGVASMSGTEPFPDIFSLPQLPDLRISPWALGIALVAIVVVYFILQGTYFGLRIKAVGKNFRAAYLLGIPTWQYSLYSFLICGALAGAAGALQVTAVYHRLIPSISSGYGYLGLMVAMLINYQAIWAVPVAFFFAALNIGSIQLPIVLKLDSSLSGVLQGVLVLFVLLMEGVRQKFVKKV
ncbi:MAG TPA: ABC transporter permease [Anaerolineales bacterium]|jgi:simple sugar transport system permease protein|nr:ABC transporter permease [Anaerolineae bacterium]HRJ56676.1 ABC transporter permease [Anaerolineales bacterium]HRK88150.1 ABC transporter permease [Anaerolineales bacterium]